MKTMKIPGLLPNWPPPKDERIGAQRAREHVAWIKAGIAPLIVEAERMLLERWPNGEIRKSSMSVGEMAGRVAGYPNEGALMIGSVGCYVNGGRQGEVEVWIWANGTVGIREGIGLYKGTLWNR